MTNAEKFQKVFGYYATEMWAKPEKEFIEWVNAEALEQSCDNDCEHCEWVTCPKMEQEPKHGEWIVYPLVDAGRVELECPICGDTSIRAVDCKPHFCENCGADMRGDEQ